MQTSFQKWVIKWHCTALLYLSGTQSTLTLLFIHTQAPQEQPWGSVSSQGHFAGWGGGAGTTDPAAM